MTLGSVLDIESRIASHVFVHIARLQDANIPLFPSLHHLRILKPSSSLDCLPLLLSPALTTLELAGLATDDPHYSSLLSFFECVVEEAPDLSTLILGPGVIESQIIQISLTYNNLRRLELLGVCAITNRLLQDIGSLQCLEELVLRDNENLAIEQHTLSAESLNDLVLNQSGCVPTPPPPRKETDSDRFAVPPFKRESEPLCAPLGHLQPTNEASPDPNFRKETEPPTEGESGLSQPQLIMNEVHAGNKQTNAIVKHPLFCALRSLEVVGVSRPDLMQDLLEKVSSSGLQKLSLNFTKVIETTLSPTNGKAQEPTTMLLQAALALLLNRSVEKWKHTLMSISIKNEYNATISMPFESLLVLPNIQCLEITGFDLEYMLGTLLRLTNSKLEVLHLPVHSGVSGLPLKHLRPIAKACPQLQSLRCRFTDLQDVKIRPPLSHPLEELLVSGEKSVLKPRESLKIGHFLDAMFPNIKSIAPQDYGKGSNAEVWPHILEVVKLCQAVRKTKRDA